MESLYVESLSKHELSIIVDMIDKKLEKTLKKDEMFESVTKYYKEVYDEPPFKSVIQ